MIQLIIIIMIERNKRKKDPAMNDSIFSKKAMKKLRSPDDMEKYLRITNPGMWLILGACAALLIGLLVWAFFGSVFTTVSAMCTKSNGRMVAWSRPMTLCGLRSAIKPISAGWHGKYPKSVRHRAGHGIAYKPANHNQRINKVHLRQIRLQSIVSLLFSAKAEKIFYPCFSIFTFIINKYMLFWYKDPKNPKAYYYRQLCPTAC